MGKRQNRDMTPLGRTAAPALVLTVLLVAVAGLTGCSNEQPGPQKAARALAAGLEAGKVRPVAFAGLRPAAAQERLAAATAGLAGVRPTVRLVSVREPADGGGDARAVLRWSWPIGGASDTGAEPWTYRTTARLVQREDRWLVRWAPSLVEPSLERGERLALSTLAPDRGEVLGAGGQALVTAREVSRVGIDKTKIGGGDAESAALALAEAVGVDPAAFAERVGKAGPKAFVEAIVLRAEDLSALGPDRLEAIPGAVLLDDTLPLAPTRDFARPVLGTVGAATAELVEESEGRLRAGDMTGLSGLQRRYDEVLRGRSGYVVRAVSTPDAPPRELTRVEPVAGEPVTTTLDSGLQQTAETVLGDVKPASAIVAVRPSTGDVLAAASGPGGKGLSTATVGRFAPGSTFKVVTSLALLRAGLTPSSTVPCTRTVTVDGRQFENYDDYPAGRIGDISLRAAVANSCNTAMISQSGKASQGALADAAASLGLGVDRDLGVPAFLGAVPADAGETEHAASMIGQGKVEASPLAMATVAASVAHGRQVVPRLVADPAPDAAENAGARVAEAVELHGLMRAVVTEGSGRFLQDVPGAAVAAKTGTAEYGSDTPPRTHAWMIAVQGDLAVAVFVGDGESGSGTAGPLLERFLRERP
jgi:cell division protein FtsI/penicillin-binding protein 2